MGKFIDLTGQTFGRLKVLKRVENNSHNKAQWMCQCECGNKIIVVSSNLKSGHTKSCGCYRKDLATEKNFKDLTGQRFGKLVVINQAKERTASNNIKWHCKCDCGNEKDVSSQALLKNMTNSCGCLKMSIGELKINQILKENNINFIQEYTPKKKDFPYKMRYDFYVPSLKLLIEYDGKQHFTDKNVGWGESLKDIQKRDNIKNDWALNHNFILIRIPYIHYKNLCIEDLMPETSSFIIKSSFN